MTASDQHDIPPFLSSMSGRTVLGDIQPDAILLERVFIRIETLEIATVLGRAPGSIVHRSVLLVAEYDALARATLSISFPTLRALGFLFVACQFSSASGGWRRGEGGATDT